MGCRIASIFSRKRINPNGVVLWKLNRADPRVASVRYRALLPIFGNPQLEVRSIIVDGDRKLTSTSELSAIIFVKTFRNSDVVMAQRAAAAGVPLFYDLCDNIFVQNYGGAYGDVIRRNFLAITALCQAIVVPTDEMAVDLTQRLSANIPVVVQPDTFETEPLVRRCLSADDWPNGACDPTCPRLREILYKLLRKRGREKVEKVVSVACHDALPEVLWFGASGNPHSQQGMRALAEVLPQLERVEKPFQLRVVSDKQSLYETYIAPSSIPSVFQQWSPLGVFEAFSRARMAIIPVAEDAFSKTKSNNRLVFALSQGVVVVASDAPAYKPFSDCALLGDIASGVTRYLRDPNLRSSHIETFNARHRAQYEPAQGGAAWLRLIGPDREGVP